MIRVVAFDLDDTLWHVDPVIIRAEKILNTWFGERVPAFNYDMRNMGPFREQVLAEAPMLTGRLTEFRSRVIEAALMHHGVDNAQELTAEAMEVFLTARNEIEFFEGALECIQSIANDYVLGALTNGNADINRLGLSGYFSFAFSAEEVGAPKPAPDLFNHALAHTQVDPSEMVYIGDDRIKDVDAAKAVGIKTIWLRNERRAGPGTTEPDVTIDDIRQLPTAIAEIENPR